MKIGIITFHWAANYGAVLQTFALQHYLHDLGHKVEVIDYRPQWAKDVKKIPCPSTLGSAISFVDELYKRHIFAKFIKRYINLSSSTSTTPTDLPYIAAQFDLILTGSDQVFNPDIIAQNGEPDKVYLLDFSKVHTKKAAYAASFGNSFLAARYHDYYQQLFQSFDKIGIREKSGLEIVKKMNISDVFWTPDPTFLLKNYDFLLDKNRSHKKYIFKLLFQETPQALKYLDRIIEIHRGLPIKQLSDFKSRILGKNGSIHPSPQKWVELIRNAELIITDSFHCTVFCIIFHRPFIALALTGWGTDWSERIKSLLNRLGLFERFLDSNDPSKLDALINKQIDWDLVDNNLNEWRNEGVQFLKELLA
ncbi:polysaccharide pyruvyl transferase family protein [Alistipes sp.]|uniref:polysaccharide pyruvyl transferase family protein n=1 Tax=Alistipes sp. TaxID=1872444 RepID=UPI003AF1B3E6